MRKVHRTPSWRRWRRMSRRRTKTRRLRCGWWIRILKASGGRIRPAAAPTQPRQTARSGNPRHRPPRRVASRYKTVKVRVRTVKTALAVVAGAAEVAVTPAVNPEERERPSRTSNWLGWRTSSRLRDIYPCASD